jgi:beta-barrel assembly-enhancing protease
MDELRPASRRAWLRSACVHCVAAGGMFSTLQAQAQTASAPEADLTKRFGRPALDTDEGGMWAMMDREETRLRRSPLVIRDSDLTKYLQDMVCQLTPIHCPDIRVHVVRTPWFNANMAPNGMMQVWSGLLLRVENEAQLAAVLGHEIAHYLERHSVERLRDIKNKAAVAQFIGMFGLVGAIGQLGISASTFAFSREQETRADRLGMKLLQQAGWSGEEAPKVWGNLLDEVKVLGGEDAGKRSPLFATHPAVEHRRLELAKLIIPGGQSKPAALTKVLEKHRLSWVHDEIRRGQFEESMALFGRMIKADSQDVLALYGRGESYRQRARKEDTEIALVDLQAATDFDAAEKKKVPEAWRSLGLVHQQRKDAAPAAQAFEKYLALAPEAADANLIKHYLTELKP